MQRSNLPGSFTCCLALQGGGAHGAFTWGVLERLAGVPGLNVDAISGTSSGAMNAAAFAQGWAESGAAGAAQRLSRYWNALIEANPMAAWSQALGKLFSGAPGLPSVQFVSPLASNPLEAMVDSQFDFELLRRGPVDLYIAAARASDGALRVFGRHELSREALLASACLPQVFPEVSIDGVAYWDGGYAGNPALEPLLHHAEALDLILIRLRPLDSGRAVRGARAIVEQANTLAFDAAFRRELRDLGLTLARLRRRWWALGHERRLRRLRLHLIAPHTDLLHDEDLPRLLPTRGSIERLRELGRRTATRWLAQHGGDLGVRSSFNAAAWAARA